MVAALNEGNIYVKWQIEEAVRIIYYSSISLAEVTNNEITSVRIIIV
jgi:hypothetical protein